MNTSNNTTTDLEAPLLNTKPIEIHSAIPVSSETKAAFDSVTIINFDDDEHDEDSDNDADDDQTTVLDGSCSLLNFSYAFGFFVGVIVQACSLYIIGVFMPKHYGISEEAAASGRIKPNVPIVFSLYFFSRYWVLMALLLPPVVTTMLQKLRAYRAKKSKLTSVTIRSNMQSFLECLRFQLGMFFGSLVLMSCVNCYTLAKTAPLCMLLAYYAICVVVSFFALCLLQIFVNQLYLHVSSIEIIISYEKDEEDME